MLRPCLLVSLLAFAVQLCSAAQCAAAGSTCGVKRVKPGPGYTCGEEGVIAHHPSRFISVCTATTFTSCRDTCLGNSACKSFAFNNGRDRCRLYSATTSALRFRPGTGSNSYFWDVKCFAAAGADGTFILNATTPHPNQQPGETYARLEPDGRRLIFGTAAQAARFSLDGASRLRSGRLAANQHDGDEFAAFIQFDTPAAAAANGYTVLACSIDGGGHLACQGTPGHSNFFTDGSAPFGLRLGPTEVEAYTIVLTPTCPG